MYYEEKIFDNAPGHESVDFGEPYSQICNCQSSWDGTSIWYPVSDESDETYPNKLNRYNPDTNAASVANLASIGTDTEVKAYTSRWFSGDSNYVWVLGAYAQDVNSCSIVSVWRYTIANGTSTYYSGDGYTYAASNCGGQLARMGSDIWFTALVGGIYKLSGGTITPYTLESDSSPEPYGIDSDGYNLFVVTGVVNSIPNSIISIPDNFSTAGTTSLGAGLCAVTHTNIEADNVITHTGAAGCKYFAVKYDSVETCLWVSGHDGTNNCIWKLPLTYTGNYVTGFGSVTKYSSGNGWTLNTPDIEVTTDWIGTGFEDTVDWNNSGFMLIDRNNSNAITTVVNNTVYPWKSEYWPIIDIQLGYSGYMFGSGMSVDTSINDHFRLLKVHLNGVNTAGFASSGTTISGAK